MSLLLLLRSEDEQVGGRSASTLGRQHRRLILDARQRVRVTGHVDVEVGSVVPVEDDWILLLD